MVVLSGVAILKVQDVQSTPQDLGCFAHFKNNVSLHLLCKETLYLKTKRKINCFIIEIKKNHGVRRYSILILGVQKAPSLKPGIG